MGLQSPDPQFESGCHLMLILVSTPIGNLKDISNRAIETLKACDLILCEDTRHSQKLLNTYDIQKHCLSYHQFNEKERLPELISKLKEGQTIAMISDAGTPGICDPGQLLIQMCHSEGITVSAIPGPCAFTSALALSGFDLPYQFIGFLPKKLGQRQTTLIKALCYEGSTAFYETPHQIHATLELLHKLSPKRQICLVRELTKQFEEVKLGLPSELLGVTTKGEFCLVIEKQTTHYQGDLKALVNELIASFDLSPKEAIKIAAELGHFSKQELYKDFHN